MKIKRFDNFYQLNESIDDEYMDQILSMPLMARRELKETLRSLPVTEQLNENVFTDLFDKFKTWLNKKALNWLINLNEKEIDKKVDILNIVDPTDFSNIKSVEGIYLGGGIDKTKPDSEVKHWREDTENFF